MYLPQETKNIHVFVQCILHFNKDKNHSFFVIFLLQLGPKMIALFNYKN